MTTQKTWDEEWSETKDSLKHFIQGKINELGIDNDLRVPDYILAEAMIQTLHSTRILHNLSRQTVTGRGGLDGNVEKNKSPSIRSCLQVSDDSKEIQIAVPAARLAYIDKFLDDSHCPFRDRSHVFNDALEMYLTEVFEKALAIVEGNGIESDETE